MVTVLVTGSAGMLGSHLVRRLRSDGHEVSGLDIRASETTTVAGDIRELRPGSVDADVVIHCAAALPSYADDEIRSVIVEGTRSVLAAAGTRRVIHISSTAVYGLPDTVPTKEDYPHRPIDPYSRAKAAAELLATEHRGLGGCVSVLRPKTFIGAGRMGLFAMLFEWAREGRNFPVLGRGDVRIQMLAADDLVDAVMLCLHASDEVANDTYNLAAARFGTIREDFQAVLDAAGHGKRVVALPARPALAVLDLLRRTGLSPVYGRLLHKLMADSYVSIDKAVSRLGFAPRLSNRDAILRTFEWWQTQPPAPKGRTSKDAWSQGALALAKAFF